MTNTTINISSYMWSVAAKVGTGKAQTQPIVSSAKLTVCYIASV